jgi:hypothetical protein
VNLAPDISSSLLPKLPSKASTNLGAIHIDRQVAKFQIRVAVLNGYTALGIPVTKVAG